MSHVVVAVHYEVPQLRVGPDLVGTASEATIRGHRCRLILPPEDDGSQSDSWQLRYPVGNMRPDRTGRPTEYRVSEVRIEVTVPCGSAMVSFPPEREPTIVKPEIDIPEAFNHGEEVAYELLKKYLDHVRVDLKQRWLGSSSTVYRTIRGEVLDAQGATIATGLNDRRDVLVMVSGPEGILNSEKSASILDDLSDGIAPGLPETLLADARAIGWPENSPDYKLAIVLAAMACEAKVKNTLTDLANPSQRELVGLINQSREHALPSINLFNVGLKAVCDMSLSKDDNKLFIALQGLISLRNSIIHQKDDYNTKAPGDGDIAGWVNHLRTANNAFAYLDTVARNHHSEEAE